MSNDALEHANNGNRAYVLKGIDEDGTHDAKDNADVSSPYDHFKKAEKIRISIYGTTDDYPSPRTNDMFINDNGIVQERNKDIHEIEVADNEDLHLAVETN